MKLILPLLALSVVLAGPAPAPQSTDDPFVTKVKERIAESNRLKVARMKCKKVKVITDMRTSRVRAVEVYEVFGRDGAMKQQKVRVKNYGDRETAANVEQDILSNCAACPAVTEAPEPLGTDLNDPAFTEAFEFTLLLSDENRNIYRLTPKKNLRITGDNKDEVYARLQSEAHVDAKRDFIYLLTGKAKPFRKFLVAKMSEFSINIEQGEIDGMVFARKITITTRYSVAGKETYEKHEITFKDFDILPPAPAPVTSLELPEEPNLPLP